MIQITRALLTNPKTRPALNSRRYFLVAVKGIVVHWTANEAPSANAMAHRSYFNQGFRAASAHYVIDDNAIVQCIPETEVAFHCGDRPEGKYRPAGREMIRGTYLTPNYFTIGTEMCVNKGADWEKTYRTTVEHTARLLIKHELVLDDLYRHYDITGKSCPKMFLTNEAWYKFKTDVMDELFHLNWIGPLFTAKVVPKELNVRREPSASATLIYALQQNERVIIFEKNNNWARIGEDQWVNSSFLYQQPA